MGVTKQSSHRRGFIKGIVAGIAGAFFALRGVEPVDAAYVRLSRATILPSAPVVLREVVTNVGFDDEVFHFGNYGRTVVEAHRWAMRQPGARHAGIILVAVPWTIDGNRLTFTVVFSATGDREWRVEVFSNSYGLPSASLDQIKVWAEE